MDTMELPRLVGSVTSHGDRKAAPVSPHELQRRPSTTVVPAGQGVVRFVEERTV
jgi:hypothetical protein